MTGELHFSSIDDVLGPADGRFFGAGYKRIDREVSDVWFGRREVSGGDAERAAGGALVAARARLSYPGSWSTKGSGRALVPHLSTIDALVIAVQLAEASLLYRTRASETDRRRMWVRGFRMRAGSSPVEDLADFPVEARAIRSVPLPHDETSDGATHATGFAATVGTIRVHVDIAHGGQVREYRPAFSETLGGILGPARERYFGDAYTRPEVGIEDVLLDPAEQSVGARMDPGERLLPLFGCTGLGAAYLPSLTVVDALIAMPQLGQVLLYDLDGIDRGSSETLWMRSVSASTTTPHTPSETFRAHARVTRAGTVPMGGATWRTADLAGDFRGMTLTASLAHRLPSGLFTTNPRTVHRRARQHRAPSDRVLAQGAAR